MPVLLPFLCHLIPKMELIRNTLLNLIMLSTIQRNSAILPFFFFSFHYFYLGRLEPVVSGNHVTHASAALRMQYFSMADHNGSL